MQMKIVIPRIALRQQQYKSKKDGSQQTLHKQCALLSITGEFAPKEIELLIDSPDRPNAVGEYDLDPQSVYPAKVGYGFTLDPKIGKPIVVDQKIKTP